MVHVDCGQSGGCVEIKPYDERRVQGLGPASPQDTRGEDWTWTGLVLYVHRAYQHIDILCVPGILYIYPGDLQPEAFNAQKRAKSGLVFVFTCLLFLFEKKKQK